MYAKVRAFNEIWECKLISNRRMTKNLPAITLSVPTCAGKSVETILHVVTTVMMRV